MPEFPFVNRYGDIDPTKIPGIQLAQWRHGLWYTTPGARATNSLTNNQIYFLPFWVPPGGANIAAAGAQVTVAGEAASVLRYGFYADDGTCFPGALIADFGTIGTSGTGFASVAVAQSLPAGLVWSAICCQNAPTTQPTVDCTNSNNPNIGSLQPTTTQTGVSYRQAGVSGAFPASATPAAANSGVGPRLWVQAV